MSNSALRTLDSLQDDLDIQTMRFLDLTPQEQSEIFLEKVKKLADSEIVERALKEGDRVPKFHLNDAFGRRVRSSSLLSRGPLVITFFRGDWCPYCNLTLAALEKILPEVVARGASMVAISPQNMEKSMASVRRGNLTFPVLSDPSNRVAEKFNIVYELDSVVRKLYFEWGIDLTSFNEDGSFTLPLAATYVIGQDGKILYSFLDTSPDKRAEPADILNAIPQKPSPKRFTYAIRKRVRSMWSSKGAAAAATRV